MGTGSPEMTEITYKVSGMTCAACVARVERALRKQAGVSNATVNLATEKATVTFDPEVTPVGELLRAVDDAGYTPVGADVEIAVRDMSDTSGAARIEHALGQIPGIVTVSANLAASGIHVHYLPESVSLPRINATIRTLGFEPVETTGEPEDREGQARAAELASLRGDLRLALALSIPLMIIVMAPMVSSTIYAMMEGIMPSGAWHWLQFALATPVQFIAGRRFYRQGWAEIRHASPGMNSLVMLGSTAAWGYSVLALLAPRLFPQGTANLYFEAAAMIVTLILVGRYLETRAKTRASDAIRQLMRLQSKTARVSREGIETEVPIEQLAPGDEVVVRPGEIVPTDGIVISGRSFVDEAMISGEPTPVEKVTDGEVVGGTINKTGTFVFRATRIGADTVLARIVRMVEQAQNSKPPIQNQADKIAGVFVPIVIVVSLGTFAAWLVWGPDPALNFAFVTAVSVMVVACPCAMGLATPTAIMVGTGRAAQLGILVRKGAALESLAKVEVIALDKTGTLTKGQPELTDLYVKGMNETELLALVAAAEDKSEHPLGQAIVAAARSRGLNLPAVDSFNALPGLGLEAEISGHLVQVGADRYMDRLGHDVTHLSGRAASWANAGKTPMFVAVDGRVVALIAISDPIKDGSHAAVSTLRSRGIHVVMLTGDNQRTARAVADAAGIDSVRAEVLPEQKAEVIRDLQSEGRNVAFVGDGINDAPALAQADVGIAIGTGTDIAIEAGDVVLISGDLRGIVNAVTLATRTLRTIRMNFFWAYGYNAVLIPLAAGAFYPLAHALVNPMFAAAAMSVSSVLVVTNSLRLRRVGPTLNA